MRYYSLFYFTNTLAPSLRTAQGAGGASRGGERGNCEVPEFVLRSAAALLPLLRRRLAMAAAALLSGHAAFV
eukprot:scaffold1093_cov359-Prasinococcus_capsulatus_cf.AAC.13